MVEARRAGRSLEEIGNEHGVTRERVRQILRKHAPDLRIRVKPGRHWVPERVTCPWCGTTFDQARDVPRKYCRRACYDAARSEETRELSDEFIERALELHRDHLMAWHAVGQHLGRAPQVLLYALAKYLARNGRASEFWDYVPRGVWSTKVLARAEVLATKLNRRQNNRTEVKNAA